MRYVLGIDQGGSKTHAIIADETGVLLGFGSSFGACHSSNGMAKAMEAVRQAARQAYATAGVTKLQIDHVAGGLTGVDWPNEAEMLVDALHETLGISRERITVVNDCLIALRAATSHPRACILCAGSGLNCAVRNGSDAPYVFGFYVCENDQGGNALGRRVLQAVCDAECGVEAQTALTPSVLGHMRCTTVDELLYKRVTGTIDGEQLLSLPRVLEAVAQSGDAVALNVLTCFARDIARYVVAGLQRFHMLLDRVEVVLSGSIFKCRVAALTQTVADVIHAAAPNAVIVESEFEPVIGAVLLALDNLPNTYPATILKHIKRDAQRFDMIRKPH